MGSDSEEKKMVQRLKEILHDRPEQEIYAVLKECGMDPDEAVQRLLSQDTFHEVKSKRERRKEMREIQDTKSRIGSGVSNGGWSFDPQEGRTMVQSNSNAHGIGLYKRENDSIVLSVSYSSPACQVTRETTSQQLMHDSDSCNAENRVQPTGTGINITTSSQPPAKFEPCGLVAGMGRPSVADLRRRGSRCNGLSEPSETSLNHRDGMQASNGHIGSVGCSSASTSLLIAADVVGATDCSDVSCEQMTSDGENTCKRGTLEAVSDVPQASYLGEPMAKQTSEDSGSVVLPSHLQALAADCSHLSFGTYNSRSSSTSTGLPFLNSSKIESERLPRAGDGLSTQQLYTSEQYLTEVLGPLSTQLERRQMLGVASGNGQTLIVSDAGSHGSQNPNNELTREPTYGSSYIQEGIPQYFSEMLGSLKRSQGNFLASAGQSFRTQSVHSVCLESLPVPLRYSAAASSLKSSNVSLPETLTPDTFLSFEPSSWASNASHGLPHQLLEQAYSQQTNLLKHYANLNSYQNIPREYGQIPFHQSPGSIKHGLPQYERDEVARNLAMSVYGSSGFGSIRGSNTLRGDFLSSSTVASNLSAVGYNDMLQNQIIMGTDHFPPHGLGDNGSIPWDYKASLGGITTAQESEYYNSLLEQEQDLRHQQDQQFSRDYGSLGNFSSYHSRVGTIPDSQLLQSFRDITLNDGMDTLSKQRQFLKQPRY